MYTTSNRLHGSMEAAVSTCDLPTHSKQRLESGHNLAPDSFPSSAEKGEEVHPHTRAAHVMRRCVRAQPRNKNGTDSAFLTTTYAPRTMESSQTWWSMMPLPPLLEESLFSTRRWSQRFEAMIPWSPTYTRSKMNQSECQPQHIQYKKKAKGEGQT